MNTRKVIFGAAKTCAAVVVILAAGWAIVTLSPRGKSVDVQEADADIWGLDFAEKSKHEKFVGTLKEMGMEKPRAYNWNGNRVFFSTMTTAESPKAVLRKFQDQFQRKGVNKHAHYSIPNKFSFETVDDLTNGPPEVRRKGEKELSEFMAWQDDFWGGGVVPMRIQSDMIQMIGTETLGDSKTALEALKEIRAAGGKPDENVNVMHYIDAVRESSGRTRVTSVWSDENLDMKKFQNQARFEDRVHDDSDIPACMGCERLMRFEGTASEKAYVANVFEGGSSPDGARRFYEQALANRGWQKSDASKIMDRAREIGMMPNDIGRLDVYARGGQFITVTAQPSDAGALVEVMQMP